ncbi:MAG: ATP-binding cassette domain-containing protein [Cyclobacteriaceae bacterium]
MNYNMPESHTGIFTNNLTFSYGKTTVLHGINLMVPEGKVYGFLGPNGAGKTTLIRLLAGLLPAYQGHINIFGHLLYDHRVEILRNIGLLIERPSLYPRLTGYENLKLQQLYTGATKQDIQEALDIVDLQVSAKNRVSTYSMGMKQRLGIAMAILRRPRLLILDEPVNGLDPNGVKSIRNLISILNKQMAMTIFLSSHLLSEVEKVADHVGVIQNGHLIFQGSIQELNVLAQKILEIKTSDTTSALVTIEEMGYECNQSTTDTLKVVYESLADIARINEKLVSRHISVYQLLPTHISLEENYAKLLDNAS